jgi:hypothetical protein
MCCPYHHATIQSSSYDIDLDGIIIPYCYISQTNNYLFTVEPHQIHKKLDFNGDAIIVHKELICLSFLNNTCNSSSCTLIHICPNYLKTNHFKLYDTLLEIIYTPAQDDYDTSTDTDNDAIYYDDYNIVYNQTPPIITSTQNVLLTDDDDEYIYRNGF